MNHHYEISPSHRGAAAPVICEGEARRAGSIVEDSVNSGIPQWAIDVFCFSFVENYSRLWQAVEEELARTAIALTSHAHGISIRLSQLESAQRRALLDVEQLTVLRELNRKLRREVDDAARQRAVAERHAYGRSY